MVEIKAKRACQGCGKEPKQGETVCEKCGMPLGDPKGNVVPISSASRRSRKPQPADTTEKVMKLDPSAYIASFLGSAKVGLQTVVAVYQEKVLTADGESPYGKEVPTAILLVDRFNDDLLDLPLWEEMGIDLDGDYDIFPVHSTELLYALMNRLTVEGIYTSIEQARKSKTVSILEAKFPAMGHMVKLKAPLPDLSLIVQAGQTFQMIQVPTVMTMAHALVRAEIWPPEIVLRLATAA